MFYASAQSASEVYICYNTGFQVYAFQRVFPHNTFLVISHEFVFNVSICLVQMVMM